MSEDMTACLDDEDEHVRADVLKLAAEGKDARWIAKQLDIGRYRVECELRDERPATSDPI